MHRHASEFSHEIFHNKSMKKDHKRILVFGAKGWVGQKMLEAWSEAIPSYVRIEDKEAVLAELDKHKPDAVMNAAGRKGIPNVDWCETHQFETIRDNTIAPLILAEACRERNIYLLHLGTGCVYYGQSPDPRGWREYDHANPIAVYSRSKYAADIALSTYPNVGIARLRMPIDSEPNPGNLIDKLASYSQIIDVENSVTVVSDLLDVCYQLIQKHGVGIFHATNPGAMRHRDLIDLYRGYVDPDHFCEWIREEDLVKQGLASKRRSNNILQSDRLRELGIEMRPIDVALRDTMIKYSENLKQSVSPEAQLESVLESRQSFSPGPKQVKGLIIAGGSGTRLMPLTATTSKQLLPVADKQMILYPLKTLLEAGIRDIMIVTAPEHSGQFMTLLGSGAEFGCRLTYRIQDKPGGIAQVVGMAEDFIGNNHLAVILGDNLFDDNFSQEINSFQSGAMTFYKPVHDPKRFGVVEVDDDGKVLSIEEKPERPKSNFAQVGLYVYDSRVFDIVRSLKPSLRGELEITDVNNTYLRMNEIIAYPVRGYWNDAGTFESLHAAHTYFSKK